MATESFNRSSCRDGRYATRSPLHARSSSRSRLSLFFFSREGHEPPHIHVEQAERYAKFWLDPIELVESRGFRGSELRELHSIIAEHRDQFIIASDEHFGQ